MKVLLVSTYELGHQPLLLASATAALNAAGHEVRAIDISVEMWDDALVDDCDAVAISVPMHTATRLAATCVEAIKVRRPDLPVSYFGLYATVRPTGVDRVIAGEYEAGLVDWVSGVGGPVIDLRRQRARLPVRDALPSLDRYARLAIGGEERLAGYVEASRGCAHRCRHCPVPVVYDGRTRRVPVDMVIDDVAQLVEQSARHITIGDPDFLNRWAHAMQVAEALHARFPDVTYDVTTKVSHLLQHADLVPQLAATGCIFVVSAYECVNDQILRYLDKGHTAADAARATELLRLSGIEPRPSWLPFMPWTTISDVLAILDFVETHDLVGNVDPVQYTIRLLIPQGSLMLGVPEIAPYLGDYDPETLSYAWTAADARTVPLQRALASLVEERQAAGTPPAEIFCDIRDAVLEASGRAPADRAAILARTATDKPRLTEAWFCCAEPTQQQFVSLERS